MTSIDFLIGCAQPVGRLEWTQSVLKPYLWRFAVDFLERFLQLPKQQLKGTQSHLSTSEPGSCTWPIHLCIYSWIYQWMYPLICPCTYSWFILGHIYRYIHGSIKGHIHLLTTWLPLAYPLLTTCLLFADHLLTTLWRFAHHFSIPCWPLAEHLLTTCLQFADHVRAKKQNLQATSKI